MSEFFYDVSWIGDAPSLFEFTLTYCLLNNIIVPLEVLNRYNVEVMTSDGDIILIPLSQANTKEPFVSWA